jgi:hypothetical protein
LQYEDGGECEEIPQQHENNMHKIERVFCPSLSAAPSVNVTNISSWQGSKKIKNN